MGARGAKVQATFITVVVITPACTLLCEITLGLKRSGIQAMAVGIVTPDLHVAAHQHVVSDIAHAETPVARAFVGSIPIGVTLLEIIAGDVQSPAIQAQPAGLVDIAAVHG